MLRSVEDIFGLSHLGYAAARRVRPRSAPTSSTAAAARRPPVVAAHAPPLLSSASTHARGSRCAGAPRPPAAPRGRLLHRAGARHQRRASPLGGRSAGATRRTSLTFRGALGHTYTFEVQATDPAGQASALVASVDHGRAQPARARRTGTSARAGGCTGSAAPGRAGRSPPHGRGATFTLRFRGGDAVAHRRALAGRRRGPGHASTAARARSTCTPPAGAPVRSSSGPRCAPRVAPPHRAGAPRAPSR